MLKIKNAPKNQKTRQAYASNVIPLPSAKKASASKPKVKPTKANEALHPIVVS